MGLLLHMIGVLLLLLLFCSTLCPTMFPLLNVNQMPFNLALLVRIKIFKSRVVFFFTLSQNIFALVLSNVQNCVLLYIVLIISIGNSSL